MRIIRRFVAAIATVAILATPVSANAASTRTLGDADRATVASVSVGTSFRITLSTPNWTFTPVSSRFVRQVGTSTILTPPGGCTPGSPCGMTSAVFRALRPGQMRISATRVSCGEAMMCVGADALWTIVIRVR